MKIFTEFYRGNKDRLFNYLLRKTGDYHLAADTMQESFTRYLERYSGRELSLALLFTISRHVLVDHARRQRPTVQFDEEQHDRGPGEDPSLVREEAQQMLLALGQLDPADADLLALVAGGRLSYKEIATITGNSEANIKVKVHRSRLKLKDILRQREV